MAGTESPALCYPIVAGPTASGKTAVAVALAHRLGGEVVSADSMQVYDTVSVGTARPSAEEMQGIAHHLQGFVPLDASYSVNQYVEDANRVFSEVFARKNVPILCGGTGLYVQSFMENLQFLDQPTDNAVRARLMQEAEAKGGEEMLRRLGLVDTETANRLHPNDIHRIVRALEVYETTGLTITEQAKRSHAVPSAYTPCLFVLQYGNRQTLYDRINKRVDGMLQGGLLEEAKSVLLQTPGATVLQAIGYKEWLPYFAGECSLAQATERLKQETRRYAKRQLSWFRRMPQAVFVDVEGRDADSVAEELTTRFEQFRRERMCHD